MLGLIIVRLQRSNTKECKLVTQTIKAATQTEQPASDKIMQQIKLTKGSI
jgi:hypothetical protein